MSTEGAEIESNEINQNKVTKTCYLEKRRRKKHINRATECGPNGFVRRKCTVEMLNKQIDKLCRTKQIKNNLSKSKVNRYLNGKRLVFWSNARSQSRCDIGIFNAWHSVGCQFIFIFVSVSVRYRFAERR